MYKKINFLILIILFFSINLYAAPSISSVTVNANTISISGSYFGTKSPAAPILWDNFESGLVGNRLQSEGVWLEFSNSGGAWFTDEDSYGGSQSAYNVVTQVEGGGWRTNWFIFPPTDKLYYSYMSRYIYTGTRSGQFKSGRSSSSVSDPYRGSPGQMGIATNYFWNHNGSSTEYFPDRYLGGQSENNGQWVRHEMYMKNSSVAGIADGNIYVRVGTQLREWKNVLTHAEGFDGYPHRSILLGLMYANPDAESEHKIFIDDVYVDNTLARVELANHSDFNLATQRLIQIPLEWSDTEVKVSLNKGNLTDVEGFYLFVIDEDGNSSTGFGPLKISSIEPSPKLELIGK